MTAAAEERSAPESRHRRNIFIVANNIEEVGGLQRVVHTLAEGFAERGHAVELIGISPGPPGARIEPGRGYQTMTLGPAEPAEWVPRGIRAKLRPVKQAKERFRRRVHARNVGRLQARFDRVEDGVVIVGQIWAMQWVADADTRHLRVIGMSHESYEASRGLLPTAIGSTRYRRIMQLYPPIDAVLLLTEVDARKFEQRGLCNVQVMHNPLPQWPDQVSPLTDKRVVAIGRLEPEKRYDRLLDAWKIVATRHPGWRLDIYGAGSLAMSLHDQIEEAGLVDSAVLQGPTKDPFSVLQRASVLALSSEQEGLPLVLAEAMATGVPCVAFDCVPGIREIIRDGEDGLVVRNRDVDALADGICRLIEDEQLRRSFGSRGRHNIERFRLDRILDRWEQLFEQVDR
ncbi:MAG TPA: glycosyltransferase family 4 protein [Mycobacteriales bacterium]|nr:glycosyltransferase family 4 protein [Mycobacteriales bacterium]